MSANTKIEWADHTFNPWIGCTQISPGCDGCYAKAWDRRFSVSGHATHWGDKPRKRTSASTWAQPLKWNREAARLGIRYRVFCASLADVFDNAVDPQWRADLFALIEATPHLDWLLLTKRIGNVGNMLPVPFDFDKHYPNVWLGATIVNQEEADRDIPKLLAIPAAKRFLSMEPLLESVDLNRWLWKCCDQPIDGLPGDGYLQPPDGSQCCGNGVPSELLSWVIVGGESGPNARPMHPNWVRSLRDECEAAGVPFLFKQWGEWGPYPSEMTKDDRRASTQRFALDEVFEVWRCGKKAAGRLLDGCTWNEAPKP